MLLTASTIYFAAVLGALPAGGGFIRKTGPSLNGNSGWLNSPPLDLDGLRGRVVLIDFWTYTCINWRRTLPYVRAWASKYKDQGLVVIGVHTPEFLFEQQPENVSRAIHEMDIEYPVAMDKNFSIWNSFRNQYWPAVYLMDATGEIRYQKFGEGDYCEIEQKIQQLLKENGAENVSDKPVDLHPDGFEKAADWKDLQSPENFIGYARQQGFVSPERWPVERATVFSVPAKIKLNEWALDGSWVLGKEYALLKKAPGQIVYRFHARDLHLIMGSAIPGTTVKFRIFIDGQAPGSSHGLDVDAEGNGTLGEQRMYQLIRQPGAITLHEFRIEFLEPEVEVYDFTFG